MLFYEPLFLFLFLPSVYLAYLALGSFRGPLLLCSSIAFYLWSEPSFVPLVVLSAWLDHAIGRAIQRQGKGTRAARLMLAAGVAANVGILLYFKYASFGVANLDRALHLAGAAGFGIPAIALPIGVSFIVFEKITYLVDIHRGVSRPAPSLATYLTYVFFFPKLLAGPILKYHEMERQLLSWPKPDLADFSTGFTRFMLGVVKKSTLANTLATGADMVFSSPPALIGCEGAWAGVALFTLQIYFDFSAYSDMAIGIGRMFGFRLRENFDLPYLSCSITEFWRRWHISLSSWIREYLYIPLGGNRVSPARGLLNLWICFLASGLWHGAAWTYVVWGAYHGVFLVMEKLFLKNILDRMPRLAANAAALATVMVGWTIFRADSLHQAAMLFSAMAHPGLPDRAPGLYFTYDIRLAACVGAAICAAPRLPGFAMVASWFDATEGRRAMLPGGVSLLFIGSLALVVAAPFKPFLYFRF